MAVTGDRNLRGQGGGEANPVAYSFCSQTKYRLVCGQPSETQPVWDDEKDDWTDEVVGEPRAEVPSLWPHKWLSEDMVGCVY